MTKFRYEARDDHGQMDCGVLTAASAEEASRLLRRDGKIVLAIREDNVVDMKEYNRSRARKSRINKDDVIFFATQLAVMVDTGVPISEALDSIAEQTENEGMRVVVEDLSEQIKGGTEFSAALERYPKLFNSLFVALMKASEASGKMGLMLQRLAAYMAAERDIRKKVKGAMTYPACMLVFCILVVVGLMVFIMPRFEKIYSNKGAALPTPTRILMTMSDAMVNYWPLILLGVAGSAVGGYYYFRTPAGRSLLDRVKIGVPVLGPMYRKACLARSLRTMSTMVTSGVGILDGLDITARAAGNERYAQVWRDTADAVREGSSLSDRLFESRLVPRTVTQMIRAGERTGRLGDVMDRVATFCENDLNTTIKAITSLIEPAMIIIMGLLVGGIAMALLLPVFSISKVVGH